LFLAILYLWIEVVAIRLWRLARRRRAQDQSRASNPVA
jgi:hypothetical protein